MGFSRFGQCWTSGPAAYLLRSVQPPGLHFFTGFAGFKGAPF